MAIPVVLCDLSIRLIWALRQHFYYHQPLEDCIPNHRHPSLRVMLLIGNGTLCLMDGADAALRSGGNALLFFTRMNLIAWARFGLLAVKEVLIRIGIAYPLQSLVDAYRRINIYLTNYLKELEKIDFEAFEKETARYNELTVLLSKAKTEEDLHAVLTSQYEALGIPLPYKEKTFDDFMENPSSRLEFK